MATVTLSKWGNSVGIRIPAETLKASGLQSGEALNLEVKKNGELILTPMTSTIRQNFPTRIDITFKNKNGQVALDQIRSINKSRIIKIIGETEKAIQNSISHTLQIMFSTKTSQKKLNA